MTVCTYVFRCHVDHIPVYLAVPVTVVKCMPVLSLSDIDPNNAMHPGLRVGPPAHAKLASDREQVGVILAVYTADDDCSLVTRAFDAMMLWNLTLYTSPWTV